MDAVADLGSEHVIDEPVLSQPRQARKGRRGHHGVEVMTITRNTGHGTRDPGLDP
jgi:hypothetical protein